MFNERVGKQIESKTLLFSSLSSSLSILHMRLSLQFHLTTWFGEYMYILLLVVSVSHVFISGLPGLFHFSPRRVHIFCGL